MVVLVEDFGGSAFEDSPVVELGGRDLVGHPAGDYGEIGCRAPWLGGKESVVVGFDEASLAIFVALYTGSDQSTTACVGSLHIADEIAQGIYHEHILIFLVIMDHLHRLNDMRMPTDHHINTLIHEELGDFLLVAVLQQHIFDAPVDGNDDDFGAGIACQCDLLRHLILINKGYLDAIFRFHAVGAVGIVEETEFDTIDILDERLEVGKRLGANHGINTLKEDYFQEAMGLTGRRGFDYVYETAGNTITEKLAFRLVANKGQVCFIGTPTKDLSFTVSEWENINRKEFTATGSWMSYSAPFPGSEWTDTAHYFGTGELMFDDSFIFRKMPLSEIDKAFDLFKIPGAVKGKILIDSEN